MSKLFGRLATWTGAILLTTGASAHAACTLADVAGVWQSYTISQQRGDDAYWTRCALIVKANGELTSASNCTDQLGRAAPASGLIRLLAGSVCSYSGTVNVAGFRNNLVHATMSSTRNHLDGVGTIPGGITFFSAVKR